MALLVLWHGLLPRAVTAHNACLIVPSSSRVRPCHPQTHVSTHMCHADPGGLENKKNLRIVALDKIKPKDSCGYNMFKKRKKAERKEHAQDTPRPHLRNWLFSGAKPFTLNPVTNYRRQGCTWASPVSLLSPTHARVPPPLRNTRGSMTVRTCMHPSTHPQWAHARTLQAGKEA